MSSSAFYESSESTATGSSSPTDVLVQPSLQSHAANLESRSSTATGYKVRRRHRFNLQLRCTYPSCNYDHTFKRQYELDRHVAAKHQNDRPFWCCAIGCIKGSSAPAFARSDKLTAHVRAMHSRPDARFDCPVLACQNHGDLRLEELVAHFHGVHRGRSPLINSIANAAAKRTCPLWHCRKHVGFEDFVPHLATHATDDLEAVAQELLDQGYFLCRPHIALRCLVDECGHICSNQEDLSKHITSKHADNELDRDLKARLLRHCPSLGPEPMFTYLRTVPTTTESA